MNPKEQNPTPPLRVQTITEKFLDEIKANMEANQVKPETTLSPSVPQPEASPPKTPIGVEISKSENAESPITKPPRTLSELTEWLNAQKDFDSPKPTFRERLNYWTTEECARFEDIWRAVKGAPRAVRSKWKDILSSISLLAVFILIIVFLGALGREGYERLSENRQIRPDEDSATVLHFTRRHWFSSNEEILLEARPDPDDQNRVKWMFKTKDGKWYPFFNFDDGL